jgi:hypothetical protein
MMRKTKWLVMAALAVSTAGCVESMDSGYAAPSYGYGYGDGYYSSGYYAAQPAYYSPPVVYSQTRYVPVPAPAPQHQADRNDHRWDGDHRSDVRHEEQRHVERQPTSPQPATHNSTSSGSHNDGNRHDGSHDNDRRS